MPGPPVAQPRPDSWWISVRWRLVPESGGDPIEVRAPFVTVGRDGDAGTTIDDPSVSRVHARIDVDGQQLFVSDLKSGNGTTVNDEAVQHHVLENGDHVAFGEVGFRVERRATP